MAAAIDISLNGSAGNRKNTKAKKKQKPKKEEEGKSSFIALKDGEAGAEKGGDSIAKKN